MPLRSRLVVVLALVSVLVGVLPQPRAEAFVVVSPPIAPPVTGFCATPWGAVACIAGAVITGGSEALTWWDNSQVGFVGTPDGWCMTDTGHMFLEGSPSCTSPTIHTSPELEAMVRDQFNGVAEPAIDPLGTYIYYPPEESDPCYLDFCIEHLLVEYDATGWPTLPGADFSAGVSWTASFTQGEDACATNEGNGGASGGLPPGAFDVHDDCIYVMPLFGTGLGNAPDSGTTWNLVGGLVGACDGGCWSHTAWQIGGQGTSSGQWNVVSDTGTGNHGTRQVQIIGAHPEDPTGYVAVLDATDGIANRTIHFIELEREMEQFEGEYQTTTACRAEDGTITIRHATSIDSFVVGAASGTLPQGGCLAGEIPVSLDVQLCDVNGTACIPVADWQADPGLTSGELSCIHRMTGNDPCPMWLEVWSGSSWDICEPAVEGLCTDWWTNPGRDVLFRCGWGGNYYTASQCEMLKNWYNVDEPDPETDLAPVNPRDPDGDPGTDAPTVTPDPDTGHLPGTISGPSTPPSSRPTEPWLRRIINEWSTGSTADMQGACWPQGWGLLNPLQWVMRPIMCALTFLFVPSTPVQTQLETAWLEATTTTKLGLITDSAALLGTIPSPAVGGACGWGVPSVQAPDLEVPEVQLIMCPEEYGLGSQASTARSLGFGVLGVWVAGMVYRWIGLGRSDEMPLDSDNVTGNL